MYNFFFFNCEHDARAQCTTHTYPLSKVKLVFNVNY